MVERAIRAVTGRPGINSMLALGVMAMVGACGTDAPTSAISEITPPLFSLTAEDESKDDVPVEAPDYSIV